MNSESDPRPHKAADPASFEFSPEAFDHGWKGLSPREVEILKILVARHQSYHRLYADAERTCGRFPHPDPNDMHFAMDPATAQGRTDRYFAAHLVALGFAMWAGDAPQGAVVLANVVEEL